MPSHQNSDLSRRLLTHSAELLENARQQRGSCNFLSAQFAGNAARLLEFDDLSLRFEKLLAEVTPDQYGSGAITNITRTDDIPRNDRELSAISQIERDHSWMSEDYARTLIPVILQSENHLSLCLDRNYDAAIAIASSELEKEEIALTQAILGDTELAIQSASKLLEQYRRGNVLFVVEIELYRHGRSLEAERLHANPPNERLCECSSAQMALGISNRVPWIGYPYPDY